MSDTTQLTLLNVPQSVNPFRWSDMVRSVSSDEAEIIRWVMLLHNDGNAFDLDPTYSIGRMWNGLPKPRLRFDLFRQPDSMVRANVRRLPLPSGSIGSVMFDPPFVSGNSNSASIVRDRFTCERNITSLYALYRDALIEFNRVLIENGLLVFKCQDTVSWSVNYMSHAVIIAIANLLGFYCKDLFVYINTNVPWSPNMRNQIHARKTHSYFLVFRKTAQAKTRRANLFEILRRLEISNC